MSLMQMAKTSAALAKMQERGSPYISVLTDPTMAFPPVLHAAIQHRRAKSLIASPPARYRLHQVLRKPAAVIPAVSS